MSWDWKRFNEVSLDGIGQDITRDYGIVWVRLDWKRFNEMSLDGIGQYITRDYSIVWVRWDWKSKCHWMGLANTLEGIMVLFG